MQEVTGIENPAFVCPSPDGRVLHAASEVPEWPECAVYSYAVSPSDGTLHPLGSQGTGGTWASYLAMDSGGRVLLLADYRAGRVALLPARPDGSLAEAVSAHQHEGSGPVAGRQDGPHTHCIVPVAGDRFVFAADLGGDRIVGYRLDLDRLALEPHSELVLAPGSGPRHLVFAQDGRTAYATCELDSTVVAFEVDERAGTLSVLETHRLLPDGFTGVSHAADIGIHPSGRFLYASNRGHDSIACFALTAEDGRLTLLDHRSTEGLTPRSFAVAPDGRFLLVGNQDSDTIVSLPIEPDSGLLGETAAVARVPTPARLVFAPA